MASFWYTKGLQDCLDGTINIDTATVKLMLVTSSYVANKDDLVVDASGANDPVDHEINVTGYTRGWNQPGRKVVTVALTNNTTDDRVDMELNGGANLTWTGLGAGATIAAAILIKEGGANDTTSRLLAYFDVVDTATNGGDITLTFTALASGGNLRIAI